MNFKLENSEHQIDLVVKVEPLSVAMATTAILFILVVYTKVLR